MHAVNAYGSCATDFTIAHVQLDPQSSAQTDFTKYSSSLTGILP